MSNYKLTKNDLIVAMLNRGYTTDDVYALLNEVWAEAWAEGYEHGWGNALHGDARATQQPLPDRGSVMTTAENVPVVTIDDIRENYVSYADQETGEGEMAGREFDACLAIYRHVVKGDALMEVAAMTGPSFDTEVTLNRVQDEIFSLGEAEAFRASSDAEYRHGYHQALADLSRWIEADRG